MLSGVSEKGGRYTNMRFINHLRLNPMCFDGSTDKFDFDASELIPGPTVFDISEVADQIIEKSVETPGGGTTTSFTPKGKELVKRARTHT